MRANPGASYVELAALLGIKEDIAAVQVETTHVACARFGEQLKSEAMADSLFRFVKEALKKGWASGKYWQSSIAGSVAKWRSMWEDEPWACSVVQQLFALKPPEGWIPQSPEDVILQKALSLAREEAS